MGEGMGQRIVLIGMLVVAAGCASVPPHPDMIPGEIDWRKSVGAMR